VNGILKSGPVTWGNPKTLREYASIDGDGRLTMFNQEKVTYRNGNPGTQAFNGSWKRIWNPRGPVSADAQTEMDGSFYDKSIEEAYKHLRLNGTFLDGLMPMIPPKRDWCRFDF
jgi:nucleoporin NUP42